MELKEYLDYLVEFLKEYRVKAHADGFIVGLSGGIDSAVVAALVKKAAKDDCLGLIMPCYSNPNDAIDAISVAKAINMEVKTISLNNAFDEEIKSIISSFEVDENKHSTVLAIANTKVRLRMTTLYMVGQMKNYLVVGTDNACEFYTGYFTKHGDGAYDILPMRYLVKSEVREAARILGIPEKVITKKPTAGIINGVDDEMEMGVSYDELDAYLLGKKIDDKSIEIIENLHRKSEHKRHFAATPKEFIR